MLRISWGLLSTFLFVVGPLKADEPSLPRTPKAQNPRVLFIVAPDCARCDQELARLRRSGGDFDKMKTRGWKIGAGADNHLQIVDRGEIAELIEKLQVSEFPTVACVGDGEILRSFKSGCTTPLDMWTFGWLAKGADERPPGAVMETARVASTGSYPLRGNHWSIDEDWSPSREKVVSHLRGPAHGHSILASWKIEDWSIEELRSLHDNLHEREMAYTSRTGQGSHSSDQFSASRKILGH
jgi:hypothetical protein